MCIKRGRRLIPAVVYTGDYMAKRRLTTAEKARALTQRYDQEELREIMKLTPEEIRVLSLISSGRPPRNAIAILKAIDLKASLAYSKPKQELEHSGAVSVSIQINRKVTDDDEDQ